MRVQGYLEKMIGGLGQTIFKWIRTHILINFNICLHSVIGIHAVGIKKEEKINKKIMIQIFLIHKFDMKMKCCLKMNKYQNIATGVSAFAAFWRPMSFYARSSASITHYVGWLVHLLVGQSVRTSPR
jgi:hypothetical protein